MIIKTGKVIRFLAKTLVVLAGLALLVWLAANLVESARIRAEAQTTYTN